MNARRLTLCLALLATGCATYVPMPAPVVVANKPLPTPPATRAAEPIALPPAKPEQIPQQFGGYYKDDGPILEVPYDLDALPEPKAQYEPLNTFANKPYTVLGKTYTPRKTLGDFSQEGVASWYGKKFHGKRTSSGEVYDLFKLTAAHPTLPIPSYARVTSLANGKSVVVKINDRGPFHSARVIDLSYAAAYRLGYQNSGSTKVRVEALLPGDANHPANPEATLVQVVESVPGRLPELPATLAMPVYADALARFAENDFATVATPDTAALAPATTDEPRWVQLGAFSSQTAAEAFRTKAAERLSGLVTPPTIEAAGSVWRVKVGPFASRQAAQQAADGIATKADIRPVIVR